MIIKKSTLNIVIVSTIVIFTSIIAIALLGNSKTSTNSDTEVMGENTINEDGKQVLNLFAKGGYKPSTLTATANTPTILRVETKNSYDCSTSLVINQLNYRKYLPSTGTTDIEIPPQQPGSIINGSCSMGMYSFRITFN
jgi:plastocyanin domain-containing protein